MAADAGPGFVARMGPRGEPPPKGNPRPSPDLAKQNHWCRAQAVGGRHAPPRPRFGRHPSSLLRTPHPPLSRPDHTALRAEGRLPGPPSSPTPQPRGLAAATADPGVVSSDGGSLAALPARTARASPAGRPRREGLRDMQRGPRPSVWMDTPFLFPHTLPPKTAQRHLSGVKQILSTPEVSRGHTSRSACLRHRPGPRPPALGGSEPYPVSSEQRGACRARGLWPQGTLRAAFFFFR